MVILPNLFDACIQDPENLCPFGFTINIWFKLTYNFSKNPFLDKGGFEQVLIKLFDFVSYEKFIFNRNNS
jgi:hypothetical protein